MAGTDHTQDPVTGGPVIVLAAPQMGENIGKAARAMYNFGLTELRLVAPRDGWPNPKAQAAAAGADVVIEKARIFDTVEAAIADLNVIYATSARSRHLVKPVLTPELAATQLRAKMRAGDRCGVVFGAERAGLSNDDVVLAHKIIQVPVNPAFASLNLAQAVLVVAYEWFKAGTEGSGETLQYLGATASTSQELVGMFEHLEAELDASGFLYPPEKRVSMVRNIRTMFQRAAWTDQEVQTFRGMIKALARGRPPRR